MTQRPVSVRRRVLLSFLLPLFVGEAAARVWVHARYPRERIEQLTTHAAVRGRFSSHPYLPYVLNAGFEGHNPLGFRGAPFEAKKPAGALRIACVGASTTYGSLLDASDSWPAELEKLLRGTNPRVEVINAGVPGWTSTELWINLELRILPLDPDVVVIFPGRNEIFPQTYNHFAADYTHFRKAGFNFAVSNYVHKELFRWSNLYLLLCTAANGSRFGWSETEEHPLYGGIEWENRPTVDEAIRNLDDPARMSTFRGCLEGMVGLCKDRGKPVLLCTMQVRTDLFHLDELERDPRLHERLGRLIEKDNALIREVAARRGVPVAETAQVSSRRDLFLDDDSHLSLEGHQTQARIVRDALLPILPKE